MTDVLAARRRVPRPQNDPNLTYRPGSPERAELKGFESTFSFNDDGSFSYTQDLVLKLAALGGKEMHHTDKHTLHRVKRYHPSAQAD